LAVEEELYLSAGFEGVTEAAGFLSDGFVEGFTSDEVLAWAGLAGDVEGLVLVAGGLAGLVGEVAGLVLAAGFLSAGLADEFDVLAEELAGFVTDLLLAAG
jgi:hypothetical protein